MKSEEILKFWIVFAFVVFWTIVLLIVVVTHFAIDEELEKDEFCEANYPSLILGSVYGSTYNVESGYIKCCRKDIRDHLFVRSCKIFEYDK